MLSFASRQLAWVVSGVVTVVSLLPAALVIRPYLQDVQPYRAVVRWAAYEAAGWEVDYSGAGGFATVTASVNEIPDSSSGLGRVLYLYTAVLDSLAPNAVCYYRLRGAGETGDWIRFQTPGGSAAPFRFLALGDSGSGQPDQLSVASRMAAQDPAMVLHTGDLAYPAGIYADYVERYFPPYAEMMSHVPFYPTLGNHDVYGGSGQPYRSLLAAPESGVPKAALGRYYSFDRGPVHFVALDSTNPDDAMLRWLVKDLAASRTFWQIVYFHHPPFATGRHQDDPEAALIRERVVPILERYGVDLVFNGHEHSYQRSVPLGPSGTVYVTTGGGGAGLYPVGESANLAVAIPAHHFVSVDVEGPVLRAHAIGVDGNQIDAFTLSPAPRIFAVVDALNYGTELTAGGYASVFGRRLAPRARATSYPWPRDYEQVRVTLDGDPLPLLYVSPTQVNFALPAGAEGARLLGIQGPNGIVEQQILLQ